jgi:hypothetical protein
MAHCLSKDNLTNFAGLSVTWRVDDERPIEEMERILNDKEEFVETNSQRDLPPNQEMLICDIARLLVACTPSQARPTLPVPSLIPPSKPQTHSPYTRITFELQHKSVKRTKILAKLLAKVYPLTTKQSR